MNTPKKTVEQRLQAQISRRDRRIIDLQSSRDFWMKRAMLAERANSKETK